MHSNQAMVILQHEVVCKCCKYLHYASGRTLQVMITVIQVKITTVKRNEGEIFIAMLIDDCIHILFSVTPPKILKDPSKVNAFLSTYCTD